MLETKPSRCDAILFATIVVDVVQLIVAIIHFMLAQAKVLHEIVLHENQ